MPKKANQLGFFDFYGDREERLLVAYWGKLYIERALGCKGHLNKADIAGILLVAILGKTTLLAAVLAERIAVERVDDLALLYYRLNIAVAYHVAGYESIAIAKLADYEGTHAKLAARCGNAALGTVEPYILGKLHKDLENLASGLIVAVVGYNLDIVADYGHHLLIDRSLV